MRPVWLVGAGPGDPELLTLRALRLLREADIVFHDALVGEGVLALVPPEAQLVSVGKRRGRHSKPQPVIDRMLIQAARSGQRVVRLKGGDPGVFGRLAEEVAALAAAGIPVQICPGVTVACAAAASIGTSLSLRGAARQVSFVTAQTCTGAADLDWAALARPGHSVAVYMGRGEAGRIATRLLAAGRNAATPAIVASDVSLPSQRTLRCTLGTLAVSVLALDDAAPALLLIGEAFAAMAAPADAHVAA